MENGRFSRQQRLLKPSDFNYVFARATKQGDRNVTLLGRKNNRPYARLGLAVPKRQIKSAVKRNHLKRLIRESFRQHQTQLAGLDIVVLVRAGLAQLSNETVFTQLDKHWSNLRKKCAKSSPS